MLEQFLEDSNLSEAVERIEDNRYRYKYILGIIDFVSLPDSDRFYQTHIDTWCEDKTVFFVAAIGEKLHICDSKTKPAQKNPIRNATICSFNYGEDSPEAQRYKNWLKKHNIDSGLCLVEIEKLIEGQKRCHISIYKDLLKNLHDRRDRIIELLGKTTDKKDIAQKIIDRCIFIRFLEDRAGRNALKDILSSPDKRISDLINLFDFYNIQLNGDLFEKGDIPLNIPSKIMVELSLIFGKTYVYPSNQKTLQSTLVPYNFSKIPIVLISNIYETFLAQERRKSEGIVFTPENVVDYTMGKLEERRLASLFQKGDLKVLDPACGSGVFLVKTFEKIIGKRKLTIEEKADIVRKSLFGIDINGEALRIAALSLYLKIIENETPEVINQKLFNDKEHFMFPGLRDVNLHKGDSVFGEILANAKFDLVVGNPPWGFDFTDNQKKQIAIDWGPQVSKFQSSQLFLLSLSKWMKKETTCALLVNLSNFTNSESKRFRRQLLDTYGLKTFISLSGVKNITFGPYSEPACILLFDYFAHNDKVEFIVPELTKLSSKTKIIMDSSRSYASIDDLKEDDNLWHIYAMGYDQYTELVQVIDRNEKTLNNYKVNPESKEGFEQGLIEWSFKKSLQLGIRTKEEFHEKYRAPFKKTERYWPYVECLTDVSPYFGVTPNKFLLYGDHLERQRTFELFQGKKLIVTRSWPIKAFVVSDTVLYNTNFMIFKLNQELSEDLILLFEAILNSTLAYFYLGVKYRQRKAASFTKVNKEDLGALPIPDLSNKEEIIKAIIDRVKYLHLSKCKDSIGRIKEELDSLIYDLYDIDYYSIQQIKHYLILERSGEEIVSLEQILIYCDEFWKTFHPFLQESLLLTSSNYIANYHAIVELTICKTGPQPTTSANQLEKYLLNIENSEVKQYYETNMLKGEKKIFYEGQKLYIFKANSLKYWTSFMAIKDANEEISLFFQKSENS